MGKKSPGHIEQLPSGSWRVKVYGGTDPLTGREIRLRKTCKTERAAQIELGKLLEQAAAGRQPETNATVAGLMDQYAEVADWDLSTLLELLYAQLRRCGDPGCTGKRFVEHRNVPERLLREALHLPERAGLQIGPVAHAWGRRNRT
jgi:hypothetical protein